MINPPLENLSHISSNRPLSIVGSHKTSILWLKQNRKQLHYQLKFNAVNSLIVTTSVIEVAPLGRLISKVNLGDHKTTYSYTDLGIPPRRHIISGIWPKIFQHSPIYASSL